LEVRVIGHIESFTTQLEGDVFADFEVSEEAKVKTVIAWSIDSATFLISHCDIRGQRRYERWPIKPIQASVDLLAITIVGV
jgi:hypothetical protein